MPEGPECLVHAESLNRRFAGRILNRAAILSGRYVGNGTVPGRSAPPAGWEKLRQSLAATVDAVQAKGHEQWRPLVFDCFAVPDHRRAHVFEVAHLPGLLARASCILQIHRLPNICPKVFHASLIGPAEGRGRWRERTRDTAGTCVWSQSVTDPITMVLRTSPKWKFGRLLAQAAHHSTR